jgi:hypothetical protein
MQVEKAHCLELGSDLILMQWGVVLTNPGTVLTSLKEHSLWVEKGQ